MGKHTDYELFSRNNTKSIFLNFMRSLKISLYRHQNNTFGGVLEIPANSIKDGVFQLPNNPVLVFTGNNFMVGKRKKYPNLLTVGFALHKIDQ